MNGSEVEGFGSEDPPVELPDIESRTITWGQDGTMYPMGTGRRGGEVTVHLGPSSPTAQRWFALWADQQNGAAINWNGRYEDLSNGTVTTFNGGVLSTAPSGVNPGQSTDWVLTFQDIVPDFTAARFSEPLTSN